MNELIVSSIIISALHALIPNHSLPILAVGKRFSWSFSKILSVTFLAASAHIISTVIIGIIISYFGMSLSVNLDHILHWVTPIILILMGLFFIWQHHTHHHFHMEPSKAALAGSKKMMFWVLTAMFFSPCLEIEAIFFAASNYGWNSVFLVAGIYGSLTILGMMLWVGLAYKGLEKFDSHKIEHNIGIITGVTLLITGLLFLVWH